MFSRSYFAKISLPIFLGLSLLGCGEEPTDIEYVQQSKEARDQGELQTEIIHLKNALRLNPDNLEARWLLGGAYVEAGDGESAEKELRRAMDLGMDKEALRIPLARSLLLQRKFNEIFNELPENVGAATPDGREILVLKGQAYGALGEIERARRLFHQVLREESGHAQAKIGLVRLSIAEGDYEAAKSAALEVLESNPDNFDALQLLGGVEQSQENYAAAIDYYRKALALQEDNLQVTLALHEARFLSGEGEAALADVEEILKQYPNALSAQFLSARILFSQENFDLAAERLQRVLSAQPDHMHSRLMMGFISFRKGNLNLAKDHLTRFIRNAPQHLAATKILAEVQLRLGEAPETIFMLERVLAYAPDDPEILALLGGAYASNRQPEKANELLTKAAELAPDSDTIQREFVRSLIRLGKTDDAAKVLEQMTTEAGNSIQPDIWLSAIYFNEGMHSESLATATRAVQRNPNNAASHNLLGFALIENGDLGKAKASFRRAVELDPDYIPALLNLARLAFSEEDLDTAETLYTQVLNLNPNQPRALMGIAEIAAKGGDRAQAVELVQRAWQDGQSFTAGLGLLAYYMEIGEYDRVLNLGAEVDKRYPNNAGVLRNTGAAKLALNDYDGAVLDLARAVNIRPDAVHHHLLGMAYSGLGDLPAAEESLRKAASLDGDNMTIAIDLARVLQARGDRSGAQAIADRLVKQQPEQPEGYHLRADLMRLAGAYTQAAEQYEQAHSLEATEMRAILSSTAYLRAENPQKARQILERWIEQEPASASAYFSLGSIAQKAGNNAEAETAYLKVIELDPQHLLALNNLALLLLPSNPARAADYAEKAYAKAPNNSAVVDTYGWVLLQQGEKQKALELLKQAAAANQHPTIQYHLAVAYQRNDQNEAAQRVLQRILTQAADFAERDSAASLLKQIQQG